MDIEFHYYLTYLIAAKAGFTTEEAEIIAHSCQMTDDNTAIFEINKGSEGDYKNYISQTSDITKPRKELFRIYSHFHFLPGDPIADTAKRKDGQMHWLNTTPASDNADNVIKTALATNNIYRIGIACHVYADTFAHQNFVGYYDSFNSLHGPLDDFIPNIGHAEALTYPDWPAYIWRDNRLVSGNDTIYNNDRFLQAAKNIYSYLKLYKDKNTDKELINTEGDALAEKFSIAFGKIDKKNEKKERRISNYIELSNTIEFGQKQIDEYDDDDWLNDAVNENALGVKITHGTIWDSLNPFPETFTWKNSDTYKDTHWYKFQEAIKQHQDDTWNILKDKNFSHLELKNL